MALRILGNGLDFKCFVREGSTGVNHDPEQVSVTREHLVPTTDDDLAGRAWR